MALIASGCVLFSHGNRDFDTCNEYKDGGLAPDDPFHKIQTEKFGTPFAPSSPAKSVSARSPPQPTPRVHGRFVPPFRSAAVRAAANRRSAGLLLCPQHPQLDTLSPFPEYKEDPIAAKVATQRDEMAQKKALMGPVRDTRLFFFFFFCAVSSYVT